MQSVSFKKSLPTFYRLTKRHPYKTVVVALVTVLATLVPLHYISQTAGVNILAASTYALGTTTIGGSTDSGDSNSITCNRYSASATGTVSSVSVNVATIDTTNKAYSLAVYADNNSAPTTLLGSATGTLVANSWNTLPVSAPITIGSSYWLCYNSNSTKSTMNNMKYASGTVPAIYKDQSYGTWPSTFGTVGAKWNAKYSIYATVTVASSETPTATPPTSTPSATPMISPTASPSPSLVPTETIAPSPTVTTTPGPSVTPMKLISRSLPAFATSGTASSANDSNYNTTWRSTNATASLTYNLSSVPAASRSKVALVWYNEATESYDAVAGGESMVELPKNYTIQVNTAPSSSTPPTSGWTTKVTVSSNKYHSRQHIFDMTGANWVRLNVTAVAGGSRSNLNMDVYDATAGATDDWIIYGSSTPAGSMNHQTIGSTTQSFSQMINQAKPGYFPIQENGSISGLTTADGAQQMSTWLALFPGKYVGIALGANDADGCVSPTTFYNNYVSMIQKVTAAGKIPVIPTMNWSKTANVQSCGPALIDKTYELYVNFPQVIKGPDLWTYFKAHPELVSSDNLHPTPEGMGIYRQLWAQAALANVYK